MAVNAASGTIGATAPAAGTLPANHKFYVKQFVEVAKPELVYAMFGESVTIPSNTSNTITFNRIAKLGSTPASFTLTEGTPGGLAGGQAATLTRIEKAISQYGGYMTSSDRLETESVNGLTAELTKVLAEQGGEVINKVIRDDIIGSSNVRYYNGMATRDLIVADGMHISDFAYMYQALKLAKAKPIRPMTTGSQNVGTSTTRENYVCVIPVEATSFAEGLVDANGTKYLSVNEYGGQRATWMNEIGTYKEFTFITTTEGYTVANAAATPKEIALCPVIAKGAYSVVSMGPKDIEIIVQALGSSGVADALRQVSSIGWTARSGACVHSPENLWRYEIALSDA